MVRSASGRGSPMRPAADTSSVVGDLVVKPLGADELAERERGAVQGVVALSGSGGEDLLEFAGEYGARVGVSIPNEAVGPGLLGVRCGVEDASDPGRQRLWCWRPDSGPGR
jgi:hypothetical protein